MTTFTENLEKLAELQKPALEPARQLFGATVEAFEQIARKNYALYGDVLEFAVSQAKLSVDVNEPKELFERQVASGKDFAELLSKRANEYVELGQEFQGTATNIFSKEFVEPVKKAATKKAA